MTLTELSTFITTKLSDTDAASITACKGFINRRYQMAWDSALFTETLGIVSQAVAANETETIFSTAPSLTFFQSASVPTTFADFICATKFTRTGDNDGVELVAGDYISFFQLDPNAWNNLAGRNTTPRKFIPLPKNGSGYARIRLNPTPDVAGTLYALCKLKWVALGDSDSPCLRGIDNALLAFAEGDMLERGRKYEQAKVKFAEGASHLAVMSDIERGQQQQNSTIVPSDIGDNGPDDLF